MGAPLPLFKPGGTTWGFGACFGGFWGFGGVLGGFFGGFEGSCGFGFLGFGVWGLGLGYSHSSDSCFC